MISPSSLPPSITGVGVSSYHQDQTLYEAELAGLLTVPRGLVSMVSLTLFVLPCVNLTPSLVSSLSQPSSLYKHKPGSERGGEISCIQTKSLVYPLIMIPFSFCWVTTSEGTHDLRESLTWTAGGLSWSEWPSAGHSYGFVSYSRRFLSFSAFLTPR